VLRVVTQQLWLAPLGLRVLRTVETYGALQKTKELQ